jgi:hypothetical protein
MNAPLSPVGNGKLTNGRFAPGNKLASGNPMNRKAQQLRNELLQTVTPEDINAVVRKLIDMARGGDLLAIREFLDRVLGKPIASVEVSEVESVPHLADEVNEEFLRSLSECAFSGHGYETPERCSATASRRSQDLRDRACGGADTANDLPPTGGGIEKMASISKDRTADVRFSSSPQTASDERSD